MNRLRSTATAAKPATLARKLWLAATSALVGSLALTIVGAAHAGPTGGVVVAGGATINGTPGDITINQSTQNAVINWHGFGIGQGEAVTFVQPNAQSVALNRVLGSDPSVILGRLSANGQVFLVNPNGVLFGTGAQVNVGGLVASTLKISDADLMAGRYRFSEAGTGAVVNRGAIVADGGSVALLGANVSNQGLIAARLGAVSLAAGNAITLDVAGNGLLKVTIDEGALNALAENGGAIRADGGAVVMTARSANALLRAAVNNTGLIEARSLQSHNGVISLLGGDVQVSGTLDATGVDSGQSGGRIVVTGENVALTDNARLDASGQAGGGVVLVGGGYQGKDTTVANALNADMGAKVVIAADALSVGDGGTVVLWSQGRTNAFGAISARGGSSAGAGGLVETSGHSVSAAGLRVNTLAAQGKTGLWLLDPVNYTISAGGDETGGAVSTSLAATDRLIVADNDILVSDAISWSSAHSLTLQAGHDVTIASAVTPSGPNSILRVIAGNDVVASGPITNSSLNGLLQLTAGRTLTVSGAMTADAVGAVIDLNAGGNIIQSAAISASAAGFPGAGSASVVMRADNDGTGGLAGGTVIISAPLTADNLSIYYSPQLGYATPNDYAAQVGVTVHGAYVGQMWAFAGAADKVYDANTAATLTFRNGDPTVGGTVAVAIGGTGTFADANVGVNKTVNLAGATLTGAGAPAYALFNGAGAATASITPANLTVTANNASKTYGQVAALPGSAFTATGLVGGQTIGAVTLASAGLAATAPVAGGPYVITASNAVGGSFSAGNYAINYVTGLLAVAPTVLTIKANDASKPYGQVITFTGGEFTATGLMNGETIGSVAETSAGAVAGATVLGGPYVITASGAAGGTVNLANYTTVYVPGVLTVIQAPLLITANNVSKTYGDVITFAPTAFTVSGLLNGETVSSVTETSAGAGAAAAVAGTPYAITASNAVGAYTAANYAITYVAGVLTVVPASLVVTADSATKPFGAPLTFTGLEFTTTGLKNGETAGSATITSVGAVSSAVPTSATYAIVASNLTGGTFTPANYVTTYVDGALTVSAQTASVDAGGQALGQVTEVSGPNVTPIGLSGGPSADAGGAFASGGGSGGGLTQITTPAGVQLVVLEEGVRMPAQPDLVQFASREPLDEATVPTGEQTATTVRDRVEPAPVPYLAPRHPRKQDRN